MKNKISTRTNGKLRGASESNRKRLQRILRQMLVNGIPSVSFCVPNSPSPLHRRVVE